MHSRWCLRSLCFFLLLAALPVSAGEAEWLEIKSPHFSVVTDAGERRGREVAIRFEQMRAVFSHLIAQANVNLPIPLQIVAFRNSKELRQVSPLWNGKPIELAGLFQGGSDRSFIMLDMATENPWSTVFHEYAHQLMNGTVTAQIDPWFEEGFAEYFSSIEVGSHQAHVGKIPHMTYEILREQGMMKVPDLFKVQHASSTYNETGERRTVFYAESALVVHYIFDKQLIAQASKYFDLKFNKNLSVEDAIEQSFGMSAANFDKAVRSYLIDGRYLYYNMKTPDDIETTGYTVKPIPASDAAAVVADIHFHSRDYHDKAVSEFEEVLKSDPGNASALRGLGYAYMEKRDFEKAIDYFQRSAKANPTDARVHYYNGMLMNMRGSFTGANLASATDELKTATSLDPSFADAYMQLGFAQSRGGDMAAAMESVKKAISLNPRNQGYYFNLADLYMQQRKTDAAVSIFRALTKSSDPMIVARASAALSQVERFQSSIREFEAARQNAAGSAGSEPSQASTASSPVQVSVQSGSVKFLKGTIVGIDCSSPPTAKLSVSSAGKKWTLQVRDTQHVLVLGADAFSCAWTNQKAALNYRETGESAGSVVSIEIQ